MNFPQKPIETPWTGPSWTGPSWTGPSWTGPSERMVTEVVTDKGWLLCTPRAPLLAPGVLDPLLEEEGPGARDPLQTDPGVPEAVGPETTTDWKGRSQRRSSLDSGVSVTSTTDAAKTAGSDITSRQEDSGCVGSSSPPPKLWRVHVDAPEGEAAIGPAPVDPYRHQGGPASSTNYQRKTHVQLETVVSVEDSDWPSDRTAGVGASPTTLFLPLAFLPSVRAGPGGGGVAAISLSDVELWGE